MDGWLPPVLLSLRIALVATTAVFFLGTAAAWMLVKRRPPGGRLLDVLFTLPLVLPPTVIGFLLLWLLGRHGPLGRLLHLVGVEILFTWWAGVVASAVVSFPLMYNAAKAGLEGVDENLEKAARTLGASEVRIFFTITLPLAWPGLGTGLVLSFVRALGEFGATLMLAGNIPGRTQTVATAVWAATETGDARTATRLVGLMLALGFASVWASRLGSEWGFGRYLRARRG
ncbi:MAG: molybdate ABC transporter permease subunit [Moorellales bacterium]